MVSIAIDGDRVLNIRSSSMIENFILDSIMTLKLHGWTSGDDNIVERKSDHI
jgi:hypothetical protein